MPKVSSIFSSSLFRAADLDGPRDITIGGWHTEFLYGKEEYVLDLVDETRSLRLTGTLARDIREALGEDDLDDWIARIVTIYSAPLKIKDKDSGEDKTVDTIRAMASKLDKPPPKALKKLPDDDIPF